LKSDSHLLLYWRCIQLGWLKTILSIKVSSDPLGFSLLEKGIIQGLKQGFGRADKEIEW
jgi:hypothetical protein